MSATREDIITLFEHLERLGIRRSGVSPKVEGDLVILTATPSSDVSREAFFRTRITPFLLSSGFSAYEIEGFKAQIHGVYESRTSENQNYQISIPLELFSQRMERAAVPLVTRTGDKLVEGVANLALILSPPLAGLRAAGVLPQNAAARLHAEGDLVPSGLTEGVIGNPIRTLNTMLSVYNKLPEAPGWMHWMGERASRVTRALQFLMYGNALQHWKGLQGPRSVMQQEARVHQNDEPSLHIASVNLPLHGITSERFVAESVERISGPSDVSTGERYGQSYTLLNA